LLEGDGRIVHAQGKEQATQYFDISVTVHHIYK